MENFDAHLRMLIRLALSDQNFSNIEKSLIYSIGKAHSIEQQQVDDLINDELVNKGTTAIVFDALSFDEKFEYLYDIVQLMKIDSEVFLSEVKFCEQMAEKLGFEKKVVKTMSARVYSDPSITADREGLKRAVKKFEK
ncbi:MAG: TerB family tellurite resistance protein [Cyclobacteriaceae bacterium]|nr:TerB family tellurite resistance protein [Cyclobacteriaceae bacterium HetDA_MAG_MS6]